MKRYLAALLLLGFPGGATPLTLSDERGAQAVIIIDPGATATEALAARELASHLQQITADFRIRTHSEAPDRAILIGTGTAARAMFSHIPFDQLRAEEVVIQTDGQRLLLAGGRPRGTLYAVSRFLQDQCGVRWWTPWASRVPKKAQLSVSELNVRTRAAFEYREPFWFPAFDADWSWRNGCNGNSSRLTPEKGGRISYKGFVHTFNALVPPERHFAHHPEWFSLIKGRRTTERAQLCLTNPKLRDFTVERVKAWLRESPDAGIISVSQNDWHTWTYGGKLYIGRDGYSPYTKYASNGRDTIHFVTTEDHPRNFDNSLYHGFIRGGKIFGSDSSLIAPLATSSNTMVRANDLTRIYRGGPSNVAWMTDFHLDAKGRPVVLFTTQRDGAGLPRRQGGMDHRFHYTAWDGKRWVEHEIAYAGKRLYAGEDDYTGLGAIDPQKTSVVYISTDADPTTGHPLVSAADANRHHEIFRGETRDRGASWQWMAITANSTMDNLRPIVPIWNNPRTALVWMRGTYRNNRGEWTTQVVATFLERSSFSRVEETTDDAKLLPKFAK